jgi:hypothetical protein
MTGSPSEELLHAGEDGWEYHEPTEPSIDLNTIENTDLEEPRIAIFKYIPLIEVDVDKKVISFTTKFR